MEIVKARNGVLCIDDTLQYGSITGKNVEYSEIPIPSNPQGLKVFESTSPEAGEPGCLLLTSDDQLFFMAYSGLSPVIQNIMLKPFVNYLNTVFIDDFRSFTLKSPDVIDSDGRSVNLGFYVPSDSYFISTVPYATMLICPSISKIALLTADEVYELPGGYANQLCTAVIESPKVVVFWLNNGTIIRYTLNGDIQIFDVKEQGIHMELAYLDAFEVSYVCLTQSKRLIAIHMNSHQSTELLPECDNFSVIHSPFDQIIYNKDKVLSTKLFRQLNDAVTETIDALESRLRIGYSGLYTLKNRLRTRQLISQNDFSSLPELIPMIGSESDLVPQSSTEKSEISIENVDIDPFVVTMNSSKPVKPLLLSSGCDFISTSKGENGRFEIGVQIERLEQVEPFSVFGMVNDHLQFVTSIDVPIDLSRKITQVEKTFIVKTDASMPHGIDSEPIDGGFRVKIKAKDHNELQNILVSIKSKIPSTAEIFEEIEPSNSERVIQAIDDIYAWLETNSQNCIKKDKIIELLAALDFAESALL